MQTVILSKNRVTSQRSLSCGRPHCFPWVRAKNLASRILSTTAKRIAADWYERYQYQPVLLETFVEKQRFTGTCYKASNWMCVGDTKGRGKLDVKNECKVPVKSIWLYPLRKDFKRWLKN
jgi:hypothetical protein